MVLCNFFNQTGLFQLIFQLIKQDFAKNQGILYTNIWSHTSLNVLDTDYFWAPDVKISQISPLELVLEYPTIAAPPV